MAQGSSRGRTNTKPRGGAPAAAGRGDSDCECDSCPGSRLISGHPPAESESRADGAHRNFLGHSIYESVLHQRGVVTALQAGGVNSQHGTANDTASRLGLFNYVI